MTGLLSLIMNANNLLNFGVCNFKDIEHSLIECKNKNRLPSRSESIICVVFPCNAGIVYANSNEIFKLRRAASKMLKLTSDALQKAFNEYDFVWFLDDSPIPEVTTAALSGLGIVGDSGLLITPLYGSFCFIGCIVTNLSIPETGGEIKYCEHCKKCINSCPAAALSEENGFDRVKCVKYVSNVHPKGNTFLLRQGTAVKGCNICREVCPHNQNIKSSDNHPFIKAANSESVFESDGRYKPMGRFEQDKFKPFPGE